MEEIIKQSQTISYKLKEFRANNKSYYLIRTYLLNIGFSHLEVYQLTNSIK